MGSLVAGYTSHITRHTSHVTHHTSHVTRHTSHITHTSIMQHPRNIQTQPTRINHRHHKRSVAIIIHCIHVQPCTDQVAYNGHVLLRGAVGDGKMQGRVAGFVGALDGSALLYGVASEGDVGCHCSVDELDGEGFQLLL